MARKRKEGQGIGEPVPTFKPQGWAQKQTCGGGGMIDGVGSNMQPCPGCEDCTGPIVVKERRCSGFRVFPGGDACTGCGDCMPELYEQPNQKAAAIAEQVYEDLQKEIPHMEMEVGTFEGVTIETRVEKMDFTLEVAEPVMVVQRPGEEAEVVKPTKPGKKRNSKPVTEEKPDWPVLPASKYKTREIVNKKPCKAIVHVGKQDGVWCMGYSYALDGTDSGCGMGGCLPTRAWGEFETEKAAEIHALDVCIREFSKWATAFKGKAKGAASNRALVLLKERKRYLLEGDKPKASLWNV